jgi:inorganic pyrophosphatase/exopolyphosphatase
MSGLISDTLHLNSPTTTERDYEILAWLEPIAGIKSDALAKLIFSSGSVILAQPPEKVIAADNKVYDEDGLRFSVSQVEELGFGNFHAHADALAAALDQFRRAENLFFSCLFVTDINAQNCSSSSKATATSSSASPTRRPTARTPSRPAASSAARSSHPLPHQRLPWRQARGAPSGKVP